MAKKLSLIERFTGRLFTKPVKNSAAPSVVQPGRRSGYVLSNEFGKTITPSELYVGYARAAIQVIANRFASEMLQNLRVHDRNGKEVEITSHPLGEVLLNPQYGVSTYDIWEQIAINLEVHGQAYQHLLKNQNGSKYVAMEVMPSNQVKVSKWSEDEMRPVEYEFSPHTDLIYPVKAEDVIYLKYYNPRDPRFGYSGIAAAGDHHITEQAAAAHVKNHLYNSGFQNMILALEDQLEPDAFASFKSDFAALYSGAASSGKNIFLNGMKVDITELSSKLSDLDISNIEKVAVDAILASFGVSRAMIGLEGENLNRATAEVQERQLIQNKIIPMMRREIAGLNMWSQQFRQYADSGYTFGFIDPSVESVDEELVKAQTKTQKAQGVAVLVAAGETLENAKLLMEMGEDGTEQLAQGNAAKLEVVKNAAVLNAKTSLTQRRWKQYQAENSQDRIEEAEEVLISGLKRHMQKLHKKILREFKKQNAFGVGGVYVLDEASAVAAEIRPGLMELYSLAGGETMAFMWELSQADTLLKTGFKPSQDLLARTSQVIDRAARSVSQSNSDLITEIIMKGLAENKTQTEIAEQIDQRFNGEIERWRSERLARTEVVRVNNLGEQDGVKQWGDIVGAKVFKKWQTNSVDPCQFCQALQAMGKVEVGQLFVGQNGWVEGTDGGRLQNTYDDLETPPIHPNCACSVTMQVE